VTLNFKKIVFPLVLALLAGGLAFALLSKDEAPPVAFTTITGQKIELQQLRGKMVLVNFWATSCPGCVQEMPKLSDTYKAYHDKGFEIVAVAMDYDPPDHVLHFADKNKLPFAVALDTDGSLAKAFGDVQVTPTSYIIDQQGHIVQRVMGEVNFMSLKSLLDQKLKGSA
jgi:peroxiredoxin